MTVRSYLPSFGLVGARLVPVVQAGAPWDVGGFTAIRTVSGLLLSEDFVNLSNWTIEAGAWAVEEDPAYVAYPIPRILLPLGAAGQSDDGTVRQVWTYRDGMGELWAFYDATDAPNMTTSLEGVHVASSIDGGKTWTRHGRQLDPSGGYWSRANGFILLVVGTYYLYSLADNPAGTGDATPYLSSVFSGPSLTGPWTFVYDFPGVGTSGAWDDRSHYTTCVLPVGDGTYRAYVGGISSGAALYGIGLDTAADPGGTFSKVGALTLANAYRPENPKIWWDSKLNLWCMLTNQVSSTGTYTDRNRLFLSASPTDWSSATYKDIQHNMAIIDTSQLDVIGAAAPTYNLDGTVYRDVDYLPFTYDGLPTDGNHQGRNGLAGVLEPSRYCGTGTTGATGRIMLRALVHTDFVAEFAFDTPSTSIGALSFQYRRNSNAVAMNTGYDIDFSMGSQVILYRFVAGTVTQLAAYSGHVKMVNRIYRVRVEVSGSKHTIYLDGEKILEVTDATAAGGVAIGFRVYNCTVRVRNCHLRTSNTVTITGAAAAVSLHSSGGLYVTGHQTGIVHTHYPMRGLTAGGVYTSVTDGIYGGDTYAIS